MSLRANYLNLSFSRAGEDPTGSERRSSIVHPHKREAARVGTVSYRRVKYSTAPWANGGSSQKPPLERTRRIIYAMYFGIRSMKYRADPLASFRRAHVFLRKQFDISPATDHPATSNRLILSLFMHLPRYTAAFT